MQILFLTIRNEASLDEPGSPELAHITLPMPPDEALDHLAKAVGVMPRWRVESFDREAKGVHLTRRTRLWRFIDDIRLTLEPEGDGTRLRGESRGRIGLSDFGQNRRNLRELIRALRGE